MEFFFLTQNISLEILVLAIIVILLISIWSQEFIAWIVRIWEIIKVIRKSYTMKKTIQKISETTDKKLEVESLITEPKKNTPHPKKNIPQAEEEIQKEKEIEIWEISPKIDTSNIEKLTNLVSSVRTLIARWMNLEAQTLIIEWLSIEKDNRDLNMLLGQIYEQEGQYEKAEYIYKDMAELHSNDVEILEKLANVLIIEKKNTIANEIYKKIHTFTGNTETTLYMLTHISNTLHDHPNTLTYAKQYVLQWPKNPEIIALLANVQLELWHRRDAIETYKNLKNLTPYSGEITEILQKLLLEEELANNFRGKDA